MGYKREFENQLLKVNGNGFQDLFYRLMKECYQDFMPIKPNGVKGDFGCDGYISSNGTYFQVYGPEEPYLKSTLNNAKNKISKDFKKLYNTIEKNDNFPSITEYCFVFNNKTVASLTMQISEVIEKLKKEYPKIKFKIWDNQKLIKHFCKLNKNSQEIILSIYSESIYDTEDFLKEIENEDIIQDIKHIRSLKNVAQELLHLLNTNDFVAPFPIDVLIDIDIYNECLEGIQFNSDMLKKLKDDSLLKINGLLVLIHKYTKSTDNGMGVMKRIEPYGEITNEDFDEVRDKMLNARNKAYYSINDLLEQEMVMTKQIADSNNQK